jgi:hypothetical protein
MVAVQPENARSMNNADLGNVVKEECACLLRILYADLFLNNIGIYKLNFLTSAPADVFSLK